MRSMHALMAVAWWTTSAGVALAEASPAQVLGDVLRRAQASGALSPLLQPRTWSWREGEESFEVATEGRYSSRGLVFRVSITRRLRVMGVFGEDREVRAYRVEPDGRLRDLEASGTYLGHAFQVKLVAKGRRARMQVAYGGGQPEWVDLSSCSGELVPEDLALFLLAPLHELWPGDSQRFTHVNWFHDPPGPDPSELEREPAQAGVTRVRCGAREVGVRAGAPIEVRMSDQVLLRPREEATSARR